VIKPEGEVMYYCSNSACPAQVQQRLGHFASRGAMDIRGIGESMAITLLQEGLVKDVADLYYLKDKHEQLVGLERMADKRVSNMLEAMAEILASHLGSIDRLASASREELMSITTVGPKIADSIIAFFGEEGNQRILKRLREAGIKLEEEAVKPKEAPLAGMEFVITGRLDAFTREQAEAWIKDLGGTTKDNVTRKTTYLVVGAEPGSKLARAQALGTRQLTEEELIRFLRQSG
jgi:DNA ligase (NAD+)